MESTDKHEAFAATHDVGGRSKYANEKICVDEDIPLDAFGRKVEAIRLLAGQMKLIKTDELRRGVESIPREAYEELQYYERWLRGMTTIFLEKGLIAPEDLK